MTCLCKKLLNNSVMLKRNFKFIIKILVTLNTNKSKMKKSLLIIALMFTVVISKAQNVMQLNGADCNGNMHDLYADLNAGKAVILHFFMPNCGSCPPPAQKIQTMANRILLAHPGKITAYAMPYNNTTTCAATASWVSSNGLSLYMPYDSGATQVANYGGFGMPTIVLLGGTNHRVMFSTQSFSTSDTLIMRDSILNLLYGPAGISKEQNFVSNVSVYPNPANEKVQLELNIIQSSYIKIEVVNLLGEVVANVYESKIGEGVLRKEIPTTALSNGTYFIRVNDGNKSQNHKFTVIH